MFTEIFRFIVYVVVEIYDKTSRSSNTRPGSNTGHVIVVELRTNFEVVFFLFFYK